MSAIGIPNAGAFPSSNPGSCRQCAIAMCDAETQILSPEFPATQNPSSISPDSLLRSPTPVTLSCYPLHI
jgi:hypothetical protein